MEVAASRLAPSDCRDPEAARVAAQRVDRLEQRAIARAQLRRDGLDLHALLIRELEIRGVRDRERKYLIGLPEHGRYARARRCGLVGRAAAASALRRERARSAGERNHEHGERACTTCARTEAGAGDPERALSRIFSQENRMNRHV